MAKNTIKSPFLISAPLCISPLVGGEKARSILLNFAPSYISSNTVKNVEEGLLSQHKISSINPPVSINFCQ